VASLLSRLGQNPQLSVKRFVAGCGLFAVGLGFIALGYFYHHLWQVPGFMLLALGCLLAAWGYIGIFANRLLTIFQR
jgi:hypothetical protein